MAETDKVYKCLNPVGIELPVKTYPLAPRLDTLDGKTIHISITGESDITIPLEETTSRLSERKLDAEKVLYANAGTFIRRRDEDY